jgi:hypothetical protein
MTEEQGANNDYDKNGIQYVQPLLSSNQQLLSYSYETFTYDRDLRDNGSMRFYFRDEVRRDSVMLAGYFKVSGANYPDEYVAAALNGGYHSGNAPPAIPNNTYADTMWIECVNFAGTKSRVRWEKTHPIYTSDVLLTSSQLPVGDIRDIWRGFIAIKVNLDTDDNGSPDKIALVGMVDKGELDSTNNLKPKNQWVTTYNHIFSPSEIALKKLFSSYVRSIGQTEYEEQFWRIDNQNPTTWRSTTNPPYKYLTCKKVTATRV